MIPYVWAFLVTFIEDTVSRVRAPAPAQGTQGHEAVQVILLGCGQYFVSVYLIMYLIMYVIVWEI